MELMQELAQDSLVCVQLTYADAKLARRVAKEIVERKLAACVQQVRVSSTYVWQGAVEEEAEHLMSAKTTLLRARDLHAYVQATHPYDEPEFVVLPVVASSEGYAAWVRTCVAA